MRRWTIGAVVSVTLVGALIAWRVERGAMPGAPFEGPPPAPSVEEQRLAATLETDVRRLAIEIGERHERRYGALLAARDHIEQRLGGAGWDVERRRYEIDGLPFDNLLATRDVDRPCTILVGAHYDSARGSPGGNDDASGVAVVLALGELSGDETHCAIQLAAFVNEEPPYFGTSRMGSRVLAAEMAERGALPDAMIALDAVGYYTRASRSQRYPIASASWRYGDVGDFVAFVGDDLSEAWLREALGRFRDGARMRSEGAVVRRSTFGATWSDHASFWRHDVPAILVSDTAAFRDPHYHSGRDDAAHIDYVALARVTLGLARTLRGARPPRL